MKTFTLHSEDLGGEFTSKYWNNQWGATGENISPHLKWENAPGGTKCFAVTMYDPAAPTGSGWWHWVMYNIPLEVHELATGAGNTAPGLLAKPAVSGLTDFQQRGYGGPIPLPGTGFHPYIITVHALKEELTLDDNANPALVGFMMWPLTLAKASLIVYLSA